MPATLTLPQPPHTGPAKAAPPQGLLLSLQGLRAKGEKGFVLLLDPDKASVEGLPGLVHAAEEAGISFWLVGGSLVTHPDGGRLVASLKSLTEKSVALFPGSLTQLTPAADALLLLTLISGRNPEWLIGEHVRAAPQLRLLVKEGLEIVPTGYLLLDAGHPTAATYLSGTAPLPADKPELAAYTALAGEYLGLGLLYLDAGSGARQPVAPATIAAVRAICTLPMVVGGGIRTVAQAEAAWAAGADVVVVGTALEQQPSNTGLLGQLGQAAKAFRPVHAGHELTR